MAASINMHRFNIFLYSTITADLHPYIGHRITACLGTTKTMDTDAGSAGIALSQSNMSNTKTAGIVW
mgnify:CR=1